VVASCVVDVGGGGCIIVDAGDGRGHVVVDAGGGGCQVVAVRWWSTRGVVVVEDEESEET